MKKGRNSHTKKNRLQSKKGKSGKAHPTDDKNSELTTLHKRNWEFSLLFLVLVIFAVPVLGPTPQLQGFPWIIRLSFLLPLLPLLLIFVAREKSAVTISLQPAMLALCAVLLIAIISSFWAINTWGAVVGSLKWFCVFLMSVAVYSLAREEASHDKIMIACALAGGYMAFIGVTQYLFGHQIYVTPVGEYPWPSATSGHKNMASQFVVMTLPFALYLGLTARNSLTYWLVNPLIALMLGYMVYGRARQVLIALLVQLLIVLIAVSFARSRRLLAPYSLNKDFVFSVFASALLLVALVLAPPFDEPFSWTKTPVSEFASRTEVFAKQDASLQEMSSGRYATWLKTAAMIRDHPAGVGLQNWSVHFPQYNVEAGDYYQQPGDEMWADAHNDYLQMLAELGLAALLIAALMIFGLWKVFRRIWTDGDEASQRRALFIGMGLMGLFALMMFSFPLQLTAAPVYLAIYVALLSGIASLSLGSKTEKRITSGPVLYSVLLLLTLAGTYFGYRELAAWHHGFVAKAIGGYVFQQEANDPRQNKRNLLLLAQNADKSNELDPFAPGLLRDNIVNYTNLSLKIGDEELAETYREKALDVSMRYLRSSPNDSKMHMVVASRLRVPDEMAIEHLGRAIELDPGNLQLYEFLKRYALARQDYETALDYYEYYIPRFFNRKINEEYAYFGKQANQEERVIDRLEHIDLTRKFAPGTAKYDEAKKNLENLIQSLRNSVTGG